MTSKGKSEIESPLFELEQRKRSLGQVTSLHERERYLQVIIGAQPFTICLTEYCGVPPHSLGTRKPQIPLRYYFMAY